MSFLGGLGKLLGAVGHDAISLASTGANKPTPPTVVNGPNGRVTYNPNARYNYVNPAVAANNQRVAVTSVPRPILPAAHGLSPLMQLLGHINTATGMTGPGMIHMQQDIPMQGPSYYQTPFR